MATLRKGASDDEASSVSDGDLSELEQVRDHCSHTLHSTHTPISKCNTEAVAVS